MDSSLLNFLIANKDNKYFSGSIIEGEKSIYINSNSQLPWLQIVSTLIAI